jgi:2-oxoglutarate ferredoxin oxidoreductase subunit alpha
LRSTIKIAGESGSGLVSTGDIFMKALKKKGFYLNADREYPSLIKGGHANYQIDFSLKPIRSLSSDVDVVLAIDRTGLKEYVGRVKEGGILIHGDERHHLMPDILEIAKNRRVQLVYIPARQIAYSFGGSELMTNMVLLGLAWKIFGFKYEILEEEVNERFASKPKLLEIDLKCLKAGFTAEDVENLPSLKLELPKSVPDTILLEGNAAIALGAIHCGVRCYYAYPMSPSSSILTYMSQWADEFGLTVKQAEDEITAAQMAAGSMFMGTRALVATSGGGFDLMTETLTLPAMIESPFVVVLCQRPGPATGLPTWTCQGDLNMAIFSGHGEYARIVIAASDPTSCYELVQHAMNLAEQYQTPVILLSEKVICESRAMVEPFKQKAIPIERGLVTDKDELDALEPKDRFKITESGISKRWIPGASKTIYYANGDEHREDGTLTEEGEEVKAMYAKRMRKVQTIEKALPEPKIYGAEKGADISIVGWGSTKCAVLDAIDELESESIKVNYLHYEYLWPLKTETVKKFFEENKKVVLIEGNHDGQLGKLLEANAGVEFADKYLKFDGRAFYVDEIKSYIMNLKS